MDRDSDFHRDEAFGRRGLCRFAALMLVEGFDVNLEERKIRKGYSEIPGFKGSMDVYVKGWPIEVKTEKSGFTGLEDYPYEHLKLGRVRSLKDTKAWVVVRVSGYGTGMWAVAVSTRAEWWIESRKEWGRNEPFDFYFAKKALGRPIERVIERLRELPAQDSPTRESASLQEIAAAANGWVLSEGCQRATLRKEVLTAFRRECRRRSLEELCRCHDGHAGWA